MPIDGALTQADIDKLTSLLIDNKDRGGFYLAYYDMVKDVNSETANQILMQAHISTYSGWFGGAALLGNALAKYSNPEQDYVYSNDYTLDDFSQDIAGATLQLIVSDFNGGAGNGIVDANTIQTSDRLVWIGNELGEYFPGNFQSWDDDPDLLFSAGSLATALSGFQLIFGSALGFEANDYSGSAYEIDTTNPDYDVVYLVDASQPDGRGRIVHVKENIGLLDSYAPEIVREEPALAAATAILGAMLVSPVAGGAFGTALSGVIGVAGLLLSSNKALFEAATTVGLNLAESLFSDAELDFGLRDALTRYVGANGEQVSLDTFPEDSFVWDDFPLIMRTEGLFVDTDLSHVLIGYEDAEIQGGGGEDLFLGFGDSLLFGGSDDDLMFARENSSLFGDDGDDTLVGTNSAKIDGGDGDDWLFAIEGADAKGGDGSDLIVSYKWQPIADESEEAEDGSLNGGDGNDILLAFSPDNNTDGDALQIDAGAGDDFVFVYNGRAEIRLGDGHDRLLHAGQGSVIHTGPGGETDQDTILFSGGTLITDADGWDRVRVLAGILELRNAYGYEASESEWAFAVGGLIKIGFNVDDEMVIAYTWETDPNKYMYLSNGNRDPFSSGEDLTAGIRVANLYFRAWNIMRVPEGAWNNHNIWEYTRLVLKDFFSEHRVANSDPLVLDLDGDGIELTAVSSTSASFDVDGDQFAERTGWVAPDDGFLALDRNANGTIDDISELFGNANQSGFDELATLDSNGDGTIDALDTQFVDLRVWQDLNQDGVTDSGELKTLSELGIESINLTATDDGSQNALNTVARTGTFQRTDGTSGSVGDIEFRINNFNTVYTGDTTVDAALVGSRPNLKGYGTLTDLHVALTLEGAGGQLAAAIDAALPTLNVIDLETLRENALPILKAWAKAPPASAVVPSNPDIPVLVERGEAGLTVLDFGIEVTENVLQQDGTTVSMTFWRLASGGDVLDLNGDTIDHPTYADILAQTPAVADRTWEELTGEELDYLERYYGEGIPVEDARSLNGSAVGGLSGLLSKSVHLMELQALRLAMQGPLAPYFDGVIYDAQDDRFVATTDRQLVPMLEAIFAASPTDVSGATSWLEDWQPVLYAMLADFDRPGKNEVTDPFFFTTIVAAAENTGFVLDPKAAAIALGVDGDIIVSGASSLSGTDVAELIYVGNGDGTIAGGEGADIYVIGRDFGNDIIDEHEAWLSHDYDVIRFAHHVAADLSFYREGLDLRIVDNVTGDTLTVLGQFQELAPDLAGNHVGIERGVKEIIFADGEVWIPVHIARAVSHPLDTHDILVGTDHTDFLDGGLGHDTLIGGSGSDMYFFGRDYGEDTILDNTGNILLPTYDFVFFGDGITEDDLTFWREGNSPDLIISIEGTSDKLTIQGQYGATYTGIYGVQWLTTIEAFEFTDGTSLDWKTIAAKIVTEGATDGHDTIYGFSLEDTLRGGLGNDYLSGGNENDLYIYNLGDGNDIIEDNQHNILSGGTDRLQLNGIGLEEVELRRGTDLSDLEILMPDGAVLTLKGQFDVVDALIWTAYFDRIEYIDFIASDGSMTTINAEEIMDRLIDSAQTGGNDTVYGFHRDDTIEGGAGNDFLKGFQGSDTYIYNIGDGQDTIQDRNSDVLSGNEDVVQFGAGIGPSDIRVTHPTSDLDDILIEFTGFDGSITLSGQATYHVLSYRPDKIEQFSFEDGTIWTDSDLRARSLIDMKTSGNDVIYGYFSADILDGGAGNDYLAGGDGDDTYLFGEGYGHDTISESLKYITYSNQDSVQFVGSVTTDDVTWSRGINPDELVITLTATGETLTILEQGRTAQLGPWWDIEEFHFTDGTVWTDQQAYDALLKSEVTDGDDLLSGFRTQDILESGLGNDILHGGGASDTYVFSRGDGQDTIEDNGSGDADQLLVHGYMPAEVSLSRPDYDTLVIDFSGTTDRITILGTLNGSSTDEIEAIVFDDGTVWTMEDVRTTLLQQDSSSADDSITGFSVDDTLQGELGNDTINGMDGSDTYVFAKGDGQDTIEDNGWDDTDRLVITGYTPGEVSIARPTSSDLELTFSGTSDRITILGYHDGRQDLIEEIVFDDGTVWFEADIRQMLIAQAQTDGADTLNGFANNDTLEGGLGNDTVSGGTGDDIYVFNAGDGEDVIEDNGWEDIDRLLINGHAPADIIFTAVANYTLEITFTGSSDKITLVNTLNEDKADTIEEIAFSDGTVLTMDFVRAAVVSGAATDGDDTIAGFATDDSLAGGLGNDVLTGGSGDDDYVFNAGDGDDTIEDNGWEDTDRLIIHGHAVADTTYDETADGDLVITFAASSDRITLVNSVNGDKSDTVEEVVFDDGTVLTIAEIRTILLAGRGTDGDDVIEGFTSDDMLAGGLGNDSLSGKTGDDTYIFNVGDGQDTIEDNGWEDTDQLVIHGHLATDASFAATNGALVITFANSADQITILNALDGNKADTIESIVFDDGTTMSMDDVRSMVLAGLSTIGDDSIEGFAGDDLLEGGLGNDTLTGGAGDDTYVFNAGDGEDLIEDNGWEGTDRLVIQGHSSTVATFAAAENSTLIIEFAGSTDRIVLVGTLEDDKADAIEEIVFDDGTIYTMSDVRSVLISDGATDNQDTIVGFDSDDILEGGLGNDVLKGRGGDDIYVFNAGDGEDTIEDNGWEDVDRLVIHGHASVDTTYTRAEGNNLIITFAGSSDKITIVNTLTGDKADRIEEILFDDGTTVTHAEILGLLAQDVQAGVIVDIAGTTGSETLIGGDSDNVFDGDLGDDTIESRLGDDTFLYASGDGNDVITETDGSSRHVDILKLTDLNAADIELRRSGSDLFVKDIATGQEIQIEDQFSGSAWYGIEKLEFSDGSFWFRDELQSRAWFRGDDGNNILTGSSADDTLVGGLGQDTLHGGDGSDSYVFSAGDGQDTIDDNGEASIDALVIHGYVPADVTYTASGDALIVDFAGSSDQVTIVNTLDGDTADVIEEVRFDDGTVHTIHDIRVILAASLSTTGADTLSGTSGDDYIAGGLGNDVLHGLDGSDSYIFNAGDGEETIDDNGANDTDRLYINGHASADAQYSTALGDTLIIQFSGSADKITITGTLGFDSADQIEEIIFDDGTVLSMSDVRQILIDDMATTGDDTIVGFDDANVLAGGLGRDILSGQEGDDTYVFSAGDGQDIIDDNGYNDHDTLVIHGYGLAETHFAETVNDTLVITFANSADQIDVTNTLDLDIHDRIERIVFDDGTVLTMSDVRDILVSTQATDGDDNISSTIGDNTLEGGLGNDHLSGGEGSDTYVFNAGDGQDTIEDAGWDSTDKVVIHGYTPSEANFTWFDSTLIIKFSGSADQITVIDGLNDDRHDRIEQFVFDDGTTLTLEDVREILLNQQSTDGNDTVTGFYNGNSLSGGLGDDTLHGLSGSDTYVFNAGDGIDTIDDNGWDSTDALVIHGYTPAEVTYSSTIGDTLVITFSGSGDQINIIGTLSDNRHDIIEQIIFDDSTIHSMDDVRAIMVANQTTAGDDIVDGFDFDETLEGGLGNDVLSGGLGSDTYVYSAGDGQDTIEDNGRYNSDRLIIHGYSPAQAVFSRENGDNLVVTLAGGPDKITILNTLDDDRDDEIEEIVFDDGTVLTMDDVRAIMISDQTTSGDDTITGFANANIIEGGLGNDTSSGGDGSDTYAFSAGDGIDVIEDNGSNDADRLLIHGYDLADLSFSRALDDNLIITFAGSTDQITIIGTLNESSEDQIEQIVLDDGTSLTMEDVRVQLIASVTSDGNDTIVGFVNDNTIEAGLGSDHVSGGDGSDTYVFNAGDGQDTIEDNGWQDTDRIVIHGHAVSDTNFVASINNTLVITFTGSLDRIDIVNTLGDDDSDIVEEVVFDDGTVLTTADILAQLAGSQQADIIGTGAADTLSGTDADNIFLAGPGDDYIDSRIGSDTFLYASGDGNDLIDEEDSSTVYVDVLKLVDLNETDVELRRDGVDLFVKDLTTGHVIEIDEQFYSSNWWGIERIEFQDGSSWDRDHIFLNAWIRGDNNDNALSGSSDNETLAGGLGNDTLTGADGSDIYVFNAGDGQDVINDDGLNDYDTLAIHGYSPADVSYSASGDSLVISFAGSTDQITINNTLDSDPVDVIEQVVFDDDTVLTIHEIRVIMVSGTTDGDDTVTGGNADEVFIGGLGNDTLSGLKGSDTYIFNSGDGQDVIHDNGKDSTDVLVVRGHASADVTFSAVGTDLVITFAGSTDQITVINTIEEDEDDALEQIVFDDGTVLTMADARAAVLTGQSTSGDDTITAFNTDDTLEGGLGNDAIHGLKGSDTYVFNAGDGQDTIEDNGKDSTDKVVIHGYTPADVTYTAAANDTLVITFAGSTDQITIINTLDEDEDDEIEQIIFDDGTVVTMADARAAVLTGQSTSGDDTITAFNTDDTLEGGLGNDTFHGLKGSDTYVFNVGDGQDTIEDNGKDSTDKVVIHGYTPADVTYTAAANDTLVITFAGSTDQITIINTLDEDEDDEIEQIIFDDGTVVTMADARAAVLTGQSTSGDDTITAFNTDDTLEGGLGNDTFHGLKGSDTYVFNVGDGQDTIEDNGKDSTDKVVIHGYTPADVTYTAAANDTLVITFAGSTDQITIINTLDNDEDDEIEQIIFDDGTVHTMADVLAIIAAGQQGGADVVGTSGADTLTGDSSDNILDGGAGDDSLSGGSGDDTYWFATGYGNDVVYERDDGSDVDTLELIGLNLADVSFSRSMSDITDFVITINSSGETVTVDNQFDQEDGVEKIVFADGTVLGGADWSLDTLLYADAPILGTSGNDTLSGASTDDVFDGAAGDDTLNGGYGHDTYIFGVGSGHDLVEENGSSSAYDALKLVGLNQSDVTFSRSAAEPDDFIVTINSTGETVTFDNQMDQKDGIEKIIFADGTVLGGDDWSLDGIISAEAPIVISGTSGDDVFNGTSSDEYFDGGAGNDTLAGGYGHDTYLFGLGSGHDLVDEHSSSSAYDALKLIGLNRFDVTFSRSASEFDDFIVTINSSGETITFDNQMSQKDGIEKIIFADGTILGGNDWSLDGILAAEAPITGTSGNDVMNGTNGDELFDGGAGDDTLAGGYGHDTYLFGVGSGHDLVDEHSSSSAYDVLKFIGLNQVDVTLSRSILDINDLIATINSTGETVTLDNQFSQKDGVEKIVFADGTTLGANDWSLDGQLLGMAAITGSSADDAITGGSDADLVLGRGGADTLTGGAGDDTFIFAAGFGHDTITDFSAGSATDDIIEFYNVTGLTTYAEVLANTADDGTDTTITLDVDNSIVLQNVLVSELSTDDFRFV